MADEVAPAQTAAPDQLRPVAGRDRIESLDVVRGFALLGILAPNILYFAWPQVVAADPGALAEIASQVEPPLARINDAANEAAAFIIETLFLGKFMFLFATLFGAGIYLYDRKFHDPGRRVPLHTGAGLWYTRTAWLLVIGLIHAFGLWFGDILVWYSLSALGFLWWVRRLRPSVLIPLSAASYLFGLGVMLALLVFSDWAIRNGKMTEAQMGGALPEAEIGAYRDGSYLEAVWMRVKVLLPWYFIMPFTLFWQVSGMMMLGLALAKLGVYTGRRSARFYAMLAAVGVPLGLATTLVGWWGIQQIESPIASMYWMICAQLLGVPLALGYAGLLLWIVKLGALRPVCVALASVGRMALTNYLLQTLICTTLFYGHGFGLFASVQFPALALVVLGVWTVNIVFSLLWLRVFRFGPAEWLWRSLTYFRPQPMLRDRAPA